MATCGIDIFAMLHSQPLLDCPDPPVSREEGLATLARPVAQGFIVDLDRSSKTLRELCFPVSRQRLLIVKNLGIPSATPWVRQIGP